MVRCDWKRTFISEVKAATAAVSITCFTSAVLRSGVDRLAPVAPVAGAVGVLAAHLNHVYAAHIWHGDLCPQNPHRILKLRTFLELIKETTRIPAQYRANICLASLFYEKTENDFFIFLVFRANFEMRTQMRAFVQIQENFSVRGLQFDLIRDTQAEVISEHPVSFKEIFHLAYFILGVSQEANSSRVLTIIQYHIIVEISFIPNFRGFFESLICEPTTPSIQSQRVVAKLCDKLTFHFGWGLTVDGE